VLSSTSDAGGTSGDRWPHTGRVARPLPAGRSTRPDVDPRDAAELELMFARVSSTNELASRLSWRLRLLAQRAVPARSLEPAPVPRAARLRFADGTTVVVRGAVPGDLGVLAMAMQHCSVRPTTCSTTSDGSTNLALAWAGGHRRLSLQVVGLDQPD